MKIRIFRVLVCFVVLCALLISISPIRVKAEPVTATAAIVYVAGTLVIGAAMIALGAQPGVDSAAWSQKLDEMQIVMNAVGGYLQNGCVEVLRLIDDAGQAVYYASAEFFESVRCAMFDTDILIPPFASFSAGESMTMLDGTVLVPSDECISFIVSYSGGNRVYEIFYLPNEGTIYCVDDDANKSLNYVSLDGNRHYYYAMGYVGNTYADQAGIVWPDHSNNLLVRDVIDSYLAGTLDIAVADGFTLGEVPLCPITSGTRSDVLSDWANKQVWVTFKDNLGLHLNDEVYYPISLGTYDDILGLTQDEALAHAGVLLNPGLDLEEDEEEQYKVMDPYLVDSLFQGLTLVETEAAAPGGGTSDIVGGEFTLDLTEYFPFCIPFDIYEFLTLLAAEPEAPVFEWVIPVPQMDTEFPISIDLSAWDGVAKLFRTFELLAFIIGLAMVTRDKFIRG